jgi:FK506-binding nuclear protein
MAAIDPSAAPEFDGTVSEDAPIRATLKLIRQPFEMDDEDDSEYDSSDEDNLNAMLNDNESDGDDTESSDEEENGGPSDPTKSKKARKEAAVQRLKDALAGDNSEEDMDVDGTNGINGILSKIDKGKAKATGDEGDGDEEDSEDLEFEEFVICTLDPTKACLRSLFDEETVY